MLSQPLIIALQSRKSTRKATLASIYNLLYYSFRPDSSAAQLDLFWDRYIMPIVGDALMSGRRETPELAKRDAIEACLILRSLFDCTTQRPWRETRAVDLQQPNTMLAQELPAIDSKWLRRNSSRVFSLLSPLLEKLYWDLGDDLSAISTLWQSYITSIASPAAKEVKVSLDAMACIASIFSTIYRIWNTGVQRNRGYSSVRHRVWGRKKSGVFK